MAIMEYTIAQLLWSSALLLLVYYVMDIVSIQKHAKHPLVGSSWGIAPRIKLNFDFFRHGTRMLQDGYQLYKSKAFELVRSQGNIVVLPASLLKELSVVPSTIASPYGALESDFLGPYTGLNLILESRIHHSIVQRKLTPRLPLLTPSLEEELRLAFQESFPALQIDDWAEFQPYDVFRKISARLTARALVGPDFCRDQRWLDVAAQYTENLFKTIVVLRILPQWMHPFVCVLLPSFWGCQRYLRQGKEILKPTIKELLRQNLTSTPDSFDPGTSNVLWWLAESAKGSDRNPDTIAQVEVLLAFASVHTTLLRMVNVLYDITASGYDLVGELRHEIKKVFGSDLEGAQSSSDRYDELHKLDSVLRESQRMSPPSILGMRRLFQEDFTFRNGMRMSKGTYACMPVYAIENDPTNTPDPDRFDGLRYYRAPPSDQIGAGNEDLMTTTAEDEKQPLFSSPSKTALSFGYGRSACPGRFFASLIIKMLFVTLLTKYDFQFLPGHGRPSNLFAHEFLFCWPWQKMLVRRREKTQDL